MEVDGGVEVEGEPGPEKNEIYHEWLPEKLSTFINIFQRAAGRVLRPVRASSSSSNSKLKHLKIQNDGATAKQLLG